MAMSETWTCETVGTRARITHAAEHVHLCLLLALCLAPIMGGCISAGGAEWKYRRYGTLMVVFGRSQ